MSLTERLLKRSTIKATSTFNTSKLFEGTEVVSTPVPILNIALGGSIDGGYGSGLGLLVGPSKHFKTSFALLMVSAYLNKYPDAVCLFYDSEFGAPQSYFESFGIDTTRVIHTPINNVEELKFDIIQQLEEIEKKDKVIIMVDSIGNLASKKEVQDAKDEKSVADMTRAKTLKSLFRMVTPYLTTKDIPMIAVNHSYKCGTAEMSVMMADGTHKNLNMVEVGDMVMTRVGPESVQWTTRHDDAMLIDIELENGEILSFTANHQFLVNGAWKCAIDLLPGDIIDSI